MDKFEKLIVWLIPLTLLGLAGKTFGTSAFIQLVNTTESGVLTNGLFGLSTSETMYLISWMSLISGELIKIVIAIWLFWFVKLENGRYWLWSLFGLIFGLWAVVFYYVVGLYYERMRKNLGSVKNLGSESNGT